MSKHSQMDALAECSPQTE